MIGGYSPMQIEGQFQGQYFYFRARGQAWRFELGQVWADKPESYWSYGEPWGDYAFAAGFMTEEQALECLAKAIFAYHLEVSRQT